MIGTPTIHFRLLMLVLGLLFCQCSKDDKNGESLDLVGKSYGKQLEISDQKRPSTSDTGQLHGRTFIIDLIYDLVFRFNRDNWTLNTKRAQVNVEKLQKGQVDLFFSALPMTPGKHPDVALNDSLRASDAIITSANGKVAVVTSFKEAKALRDRGVIPMMLLLEGADALEDRLERLSELKRKGLKIVGLVAGHGNGFADSAVSPRKKSGLTEKGFELLEACNDIGLLVDLTHASPGAFWDVLIAQLGAVMVSHTAVRAIRDHPRNLNDLQIMALARFGGLMGLVFNPEFLRSGTDTRATLGDVVKHVMYIKELGAIETLSLGTDFNGIRPPLGLEDVSKLPAFTEALLNQGLQDGEVAGIIGGNAHRFFEENERSRGSLSFAQSEILRPIDLDCDSVVGEHEGVATAACNRYVLDKGPLLPQPSRLKVRIKDMTRTPARLELFGEPSTPWQIEGQNLVGKVLFNRMVALDARGRGTLLLPAGRQLTRVFCSPTRPSHLHEVVVWGH